MPFQSEKQRRYLWANEPEIARDWTDTYGSRIQRDKGGIANYSMQGNVRNYLGEQKMVEAPLHWQSGPDHPKTQLAYITKPELDLILKADFHGSLKDGPNVGPSGIMSLNDPGTGRSGSEMSSAETTGSFGPDLASTPESRGIRSGAIAAGSPRTPRDHINAFNLSQWNQRFTPYKQRIKPGGTGIGGGWKRFTDWMGGLGNRLRTVDGVVRDQSYFSEEERNKRRAQRSIDTILNRKAPVTDLTNKRLNQLYNTLGTGTGQRNLFADADIGRSPEMMNMSNLGLYNERIGQPIGPGKRVGQDQGYYGLGSRYDNQAVKPPASEYEGMWDNRGIKQTRSALDFIDPNLATSTAEIYGMPWSKRIGEQQGINLQEAGYIPDELGVGKYSDKAFLHKKATTEGVGAKEFGEYIKGAELGPYTDYANKLLNELKLSDKVKSLGEEYVKGLDIKGRDKYDDQRKAVGTLLEDVKTKKEALKGTDKSWMLDPSADKRSAVREFTSDYSENEDRLNDLGITTREEYEDFIKKSIGIAHGGRIDKALGGRSRDI